MSNDAVLAVRRRARRRSARRFGFTYLGLLFLLFLLALTAAAAGTLWSFVAQRDRERQLLFVGHEYRLAIDRFRRSHVGSAQPFPTSLAQLLGNREELVVKRYLRRLYFDPMTGNTDWGVMKTPLGGIFAVYSLSEREPLRRTGIYPDDAIDFVKARSYRDWVFAAAPLPQPVPTVRSGVGDPHSIAPGGDQDDPGAPPPPPPPPTNGD